MSKRGNFVRRLGTSRKAGRIVAVVLSTVLFTGLVGVAPAGAAVPTWPSGQYMGVLKGVPFTIPIAVSAGAPLTAMSVITAPANTSGFALSNINLTAGTADMVGTYTANPSGATVTAAIRATNTSGNSSNSSFALEAYTCSWASPAGTTTSVFDANQAEYVTGTQTGYNAPVTNGVSPGTQLSPTCTDLDVPGLGASTLTVSNPFSGTISPQNNDNDSSESDMNAGCGIVSILGTKTGSYSGSTCSGHSTVPNPWANGGTLSLSIGSQSDKGDTNGALTNCPPSQAAVNAGLITCTDTGSTGSSSYSWNFTADQFLYTGQNLPQQPTATLSASTVLAGSSVNVTGSSNWWGDAAGAPQTGTGHTQSGSYYSVPAPSVFVGTSRGTAVAAASSSLHVSATAYACGQASSSVAPNPCTFTPGALSGSFTLPNSLTPGTYHVYIDETNTSPLYGNGPNDSYQTARGTNLGTAESDTTITIGTAPAITSAATTTFTAGSAGSFTVTTSGSPAPALSKTGALPSGVTFVDNGNGTATIAGTPATGTGGVYPISITAANGLGTNATQSFSLVVDEQPSITSGSSASFSVGSAGSFVVTTTGYPNAAESETGALPSGVTFTDNGDGTATIAGTPGAGTAADYPITITATNGVGSDANQSFTLVVNQAPAFTSAPSATFTTGAAGTFTVVSSARPNATLTETGALPAGVSFTDNGNGTATLAGTPGTLTGGLYQLTITAANGVGSNAHQSFSLFVDDAPAITSAASATFTTGSAGSFGVTTTGYPAPAISETGPLPSGVTLVDNGDGTATLAGTPDPGTGGVYSISITASNGVGSDATQSFTLTVDQAPAITSGNSTTFTVGSLGSFSVTSTGFPTAALSESGALPSGVTLVDNGDGTATLSGTPAAGTGGLYAFGINASNGIGSDANQSFTLTVDEAPSITSASSAEFAQGSADTFTVTTIGYPHPSLSETGALPSGVTFVDNGNGTGTLSGTPSIGSAGPYSLSFSASNGIGSDASQAFSLTVTAAPVITSASSATFTAGSAGSFTVISNGVPTPSLSQTGALPSGVTFVDNGDGTATLSGTPATGTGGVYSLTITATNGIGTPGHQTFTLTVDEAPVITSAASALFTVGGPQSFVVTTTGVPAPALSEIGALPSGVTFVDNGDGTASLSGTPATGTGGTYHVTIGATNGIAPDASQAFTLTVNEAPAITSAASTTFTVGSAGTFAVTSFANPTSALSETGALPSGVTFVDNGDGNGTLAGTPAVGTGGLYQITITASNGVGADAHQSFSLFVDESPAITSAASTTFTTGVAGSFTITTSGYPDPAITRTGGLPSGVTLVDNGDGTATLAGTPAGGTGGVYSITITASNGVGSDASQPFTLTVNQASAITSAPTTTFVVGHLGSFTVTFTGHPTPAMSEAGFLPSGVMFVDNHNGTATLSGTPASGTMGDYPLTLTASNGVGPDAHQSFTLRIAQASTITSASTAAFVEHTPSMFTVTTTGFPVATIVETGVLPAGVTFHDNGNGTATLSGTPTSVGVFSVDISASNGIGVPAHMTFVLTSGNVPAITSAASAQFQVGVPGSMILKSTGFPVPSVTSVGGLPAGVTFQDNGDGTATLTGTPGPRSAGSYHLSLTAANGVGGNAHQTFNLVVGTVRSVSTGDGAIMKSEIFHDTNLIIPVSLSKPSTSAVTVKYQLRGITAVGGESPGRGIDFIDLGGEATKITFPAGTVEQYVSVRVEDNTIVKSNLTFSLTLSDPTGSYILGRSTGTGTIIKLVHSAFDAYTHVSVGDTSVVEGNAGSPRDVTVRVTMSNPRTYPVTVKYTVAGLTATYGSSSSVAGADFGGPKTGSIVVPTDAMGAWITIPVYADSRIEPNETIRVTLNSVSPGATLARTVGTATILNDD